MAVEGAHTEHSRAGPSCCERSCTKRASSVLTAANDEQIPECYGGRSEGKRQSAPALALLPMLASLRRSTGLPHRIVVDEAHYFLQEPNVKELLDFEQGSYTILTYRPSDLHPDLRQKVEYIIAKRLTRRMKYKRC